MILLLGYPHPIPPAAVVGPFAIIIDYRERFKWLGYSEKQSAREGRMGLVAEGRVHVRDSVVEFHHYYRF